MCGRSNINSLGCGALRPWWVQWNFVWSEKRKDNYCNARWKRFWLAKIWVIGWVAVSFGGFGSTAEKQLALTSQSFLNDDEYLRMLVNKTSFRTCFKGMSAKRNLYKYTMCKLTRSLLPILCLLVEPSGLMVGVCWRCNSPCGKALDNIYCYSVFLSNRWWVVGGMVRREKRKTGCPNAVTSLARIV